MNTNSERIICRALYIIYDNINKNTKFSVLHF